MKKVLLINNYFNGGGAERVFYNTISAIKLYKQDLQLYTATCDLEIPPELKMYINTHLNFSKSKDNPINYVFNFINFVKLYKFLFKHKIDVIHLHNFYGDISPSILLAIRFYKRKNKVKVLQTIHDYSILCPNSSLYNYSQNKVCEKCIGEGIKYKIISDGCYHGKFLVNFLKFIRTQIALSVLKHKNIIELFITPSEFLKEKLVKEGIPQKKIFLIRNPIIEVNHQNCEKRKTITYVGRLSPEKGVELLINAYIRLKESRFLDPEWELYIVGNGPEEKKLKSLSNFYYNVKFWGWLEHKEVTELIQVSQLLVLPSLWYENAPNVLIEGILNHTKVLVTNHGGMKEFSNIFPHLIYTFEYNENKEIMIKNLLEVLVDILYDINNKWNYYSFELPYEFKINFYSYKITEIYLQGT